MEEDHPWVFVTDLKIVQEALQVREEKRQML
jgi:hypothetical protein